MVLAFSRALTLLKERASWRVVGHGSWITTVAFIGLYISVWVEGCLPNSLPTA
jgi:hypothetical protein